MFRKFPILMLLLLLALFASAVSAQEDDENILAVTRIDSETVIPDEIENIGSPKLYTFVGSAGDVVTISMVADDPEALDPFLVLLGSAGEVYMINDDVSSTDFSARINNFELPDDGAYFVLATTFNDLVQGGIDPADTDNDEPLGYQIGLTGATVPPGLEDESEFEYIAAELEIGDEVILEITPEEPVFYVTFLAQEGDVIDILTDENNNEFVNTLIYVFDRSGNRLAASSGGSSADDFYAAIEGFEVPEDGLYLVFATASNFYQAFQDNWQGYGAFVFVIQ
jgi:hypothetical protein